MKFLSDILAKAGLTVDGVVTLNNTATGQTPDANDNSTKLATTAWVRTFVQPYSLPIASSSVLGGIKVGTGLSIDATTGVLSASGGSGGSFNFRTIQEFTATSGQTTFTISGGYVVGYVEVLINGVYLSESLYTATNGSTIVLDDAAAADDIVTVFLYSIYNFGGNIYARNVDTLTATAGQTSFTTSYIPGQIDVYYNGSKLTAAEYTATSGTAIVLGQAAVSGDIIEVVTYLAGAGLNANRTLTINGTTYDLTANRTWTLTTANISEVTNLYYTDARARAAISVTGSGSYNSSTGVITVTGGVTSVNTLIGAVTLTTTNIAEGTNLYYTDARVATYLTTNSYATQSYVGTAISNLVASSPATLDTLNELALALGSDPNFATTVATSIGTKQAQLNGTGFVKISGTTISYDNSTYALDSAVVKLAVTQTITGAKTFTQRITTDEGLILKDLGSATYITPSSGYGGISYNNTVAGYSRYYFSENNGSTSILNFPTTVSSKVYTYPNASGILALTSDIPTNNNVLTNGAGYITSSALSGYLPLSGGTLTGALNGTSLGLSNFLTAIATSDIFYGMQIYGSAGSGARKIFVAGKTGFENGFTVDYNGSAFVYAFNSGTTTFYGALTGTSATFNGTVTMGTSGTNYIRMGVFPNSTSNSGEAWIGRASDRNAGTMTIQLGGGSASSRSFEVVDYAWSKVLFSVSSAGNLATTGRIHAGTYGNASRGSFLMGIENDAESKWAYLCSTQYNSSTNPSGFSVIGSFTTATENKVIIGGSIYEANPCTSIEFWAHTAVTHATGGTLRMRITTDGIKGAVYFDAQTSSGFRIRNSNDTANAGGWTRRGLWEGNANFDPALWAETGYGLYFYSNGSADIRAFFNTSGHFVPGATNTYNLGSSTNAWANIYTNDLHLSNMNKPEGNDIDGTSGNWTIQEGAENLYIINNLSKKRFKINLEEIL